jgi:hypothetical protein
MASSTTSSQVSLCCGLKNDTKEGAEQDLVQLIQAAASDHTRAYAARASAPVSEIDKRGRRLSSWREIQPHSDRRLSDRHCSAVIATREMFCGMLMALLPFRAT